MKTDKNDNQTNSSKEKNEITRKFEEIWDQAQDPEAKERKRIEKLREERQDTSDLGI